jgi:hypothetical protein
LIKGELRIQYDSKFIPAENKKIVLQRGGLDCPLYALITGFRLIGIFESITRLRRKFHQEGFRYHSWGFFFPAIALYLTRTGKHSIYKTYESYLDTYKIATKTKACNLFNEKIILNHPHDKELRSILIELKRRQSLILKISPVNFNDLICSLNKKHMALVVIDSQQYYGISDLWLHTVLCVREDTETIRVYDPYIVKGHSDYEQWNHAIQHANNFDWKKWRGELISF